MIKFKIIENNNIEDSNLYLKNRYRKVVIEGSHTKKEYDELLQSIMTTNSNYIKALQWTEWIDVWYQKYYEILWNHRNEFILKSYDNKNTTNVNLSLAEIFSKLKNKKLLTEKDMPKEDLINYPKITINPVEKHNAFVNLEFIVEFAEWSQPVDEWNLSFDNSYDSRGLNYFASSWWKHPSSDTSYYLGLDVKPYKRITQNISGLMPLIPYDNYLYIKDNIGQGWRDYNLEQWNHQKQKNQKQKLSQDLPLLFPSNVYYEDTPAVWDEDSQTYIGGGAELKVDPFTYTFSGYLFITASFVNHQNVLFNDNSNQLSYYNKFYNKIFGPGKYATIGDPGNSIFFLRYLNNLTNLTSPPNEQIVYDWWRHIDDYAFVTKERVFRHPNMNASIDFTNDGRNNTNSINSSLKSDIRKLTYIRPYLTKFNMYKLSVPMDARIISDNLKIIFPNWNSFGKPLHDETKPDEMQHQLLCAQILWKRGDGSIYRRLLNNTMFISDWFEPEKYNVGENKNTQREDREFLAYDWKKEFIKGRKGIKITNDDSWSIPSDIPMEQVLSTKLNENDKFLGINIFIWLTDRYYPYNRDTEIIKSSLTDAMEAIYSKENYFNFPSRIPLSKIGSNWDFDKTLVWMNKRGVGELESIKIDHYLILNNELRSGAFRKEVTKQQAQNDPKWSQDINNFRDDFAPNEGMFTQFMNILNLVHRG